MMTCHNMLFNLLMSIRQKILPSFQIASFFPQLRNTNRSTGVLPPAPLSRLAPDKMWPSNLLTSRLKCLIESDSHHNQQKSTQKNGGLGWCGRCGPNVQHPILIQKQRLQRTAQRSAIDFRSRKWWWGHGQSQHLPNLENVWHPNGDPTIRSGRRNSRFSGRGCGCCCCCCWFTINNKNKRECIIQGISSVAIAMNWQKRTWDPLS